MRGLRGRVAIITGGASGIGRATCERFVREGVGVAVADIDEPAATETCRFLHSLGGHAISVVTDVTDSRSVAALVEFTVSKYDRIDILVNCAANFIMRGIEA